MTEPRPETPDKLLDDLESLQALLDQDADDLRIPVLSHVVEPADAGAPDAMAPAVAASTLELDFDGFEVDEQLFMEGLGLEAVAAAAPAAKPAALAVPAPAPAHGPDETAARAADDDLAAALVDQCLAELEDLLRPRLTQLCRDLLARRTPPGME